MLVDISEHGTERGVSCLACGKDETISIMRLRTLVDLARRIIDADDHGNLGTSARHPPGCR